MSQLDEEAVKNLFNDILRVWIRPEMDRRLKDGQIRNEFVLNKAQVLIRPDKLKPEIRLNKEVKAQILATFIGKYKELGGQVYDNELGDEIHDIELTDDDDPNCGHLTMLLFKGRWVIHFDFRVNKPKAKERYDVAKEFYEVAKICYEKSYWRAFVDNLFSSAELLVTGQIMVLSLLGTKSNNPKHSSIQYAFNSFVDGGNAKPGHKEVFNKLSGLRDSGRYLNQDFKLNPDETEQMLKDVDDIFIYTEKIIT